MGTRKTRGEYRPIYEALFYSADYQKLSSDGRLVLVTLKGLLGPIGAKPMPGLAELLTIVCGLMPKRCRAAIKELQQNGWIEYENHVVWLVNGLKYEPQLSTGEKHQPYIASLLAQLPSGRIKEAFRRKYAEYLPPDERPPRGRVSDRPSDRVSDTPADTTPHPTTTNTPPKEDGGKSRSSVKSSAPHSSTITDAFNEAAPWVSPVAHEALRALLEAVPEPVHWVGILRGYASGLTTGKPVPHARLASAIQDYVASGEHRKPNAKHFRGFVRNAKAPGTDTPQPAADFVREDMALELKNIRESNQRRRLRGEPEKPEPTWAPEIDAAFPDGRTRPGLRIA